MKLNQINVITNTILYLGTNFTSNDLLYQGVHNLIQQDAAKLLFGKRIKAIFTEPSYTLMLSNLCFSDTVTFTLLVSSAIVDTGTLGPTFGRSAKVRIVTGMHFI